MVLETIRETRLTQPNVSARIHTGTPDRFPLECARTIRLGIGMPAIKNDEIIVPALLDKGVRSEDAYDYAIVGCIEAAVPGKWGYRNTGMSFLNLLKVLELTLNDGKDPATGTQLLPGHGDLTAFDSMESLYAAYREQLRYYIRMSIEADTVADLCLEYMAPDAFCSALVDDCIARAKTIKEGGAVYDIVSGLQSGVSNVADAFMALKTRVFDEKVVTAAQVMESFAADFQNPGGELVRQRLLRAPKYGNDIAEVDGVAARVLNDYLDEANHYHNTRHGRGPIGGGYAGSTSNISANVPLGASVGATPDGRRAGEPLAEGVSPVHGCDTGGPAKVLRSLSRLPTIKSIAQLLNLRLSPESLESEEGLNRLVVLLKGVPQPETLARAVQHRQHAGSPGRSATTREISGPRGAGSRVQRAIRDARPGDAGRHHPPHVLRIELNRGERNPGYARSRCDSSKLADRVAVVGGGDAERAAGEDRGVEGVEGRIECGHPAEYQRLP